VQLVHDVTVKVDAEAEVQGGFCVTAGLTAFEPTGQRDWQLTEQISNLGCMAP